MSHGEYDRRMKELSRKLEMLALARSGAADIKRIKVSGYSVPAYTVRPHTRVIFQRTT